MSLRPPATWVAFFLCLWTTAPARCEPVTADRLSRAADDPDAYVIDGHYLRGEKRIARMRARGELPDEIPDGRCKFEIAGDPSVVYYARECP